MNIEILLNTGIRVTAPVLYKKGIFIITNNIGGEKLLKTYQIALDDGDYPKIAGLTNKRTAIVLCNFLAKTIKNEKAVLYKNKYYITKIIKPLLIDWLLNRKLYKATIGYTPLAEISQ
jgi:hypothetical protein